MSVSIDLERGNMCVKPILICANCNGEIANVGESYSHGERYPDTLLKCKKCEKEGKIKGEQWRTVISLYKKFRLSEQKASGEE